MPVLLPARISTGCAGLDDVMNGGLAADRLYLLEGVPGSGKTTLAIQFLLDGVKLGERVLYVTLSESADELRAIAASHGWSLEGIHVRELIASDDLLQEDQQYTMFHPSEVELGEATLDVAARRRGRCIRGGLLIVVGQLRAGSCEVDRAYLLVHDLDGRRMHRVDPCR